MDETQVAAFWESNAEAWTRQTRSGIDVFRDLLNTPAFLALMPPIGALRGLDVGCGEGFNTRQLAGRGARMWAVDIAPTFVRHANEAEKAHPLGIDYRLGDGMRLPFATASFDFVTAFMSFMDMPEPARAILEASRVLRPGGFLQFSILHPCFMPPVRKVLRDRQGVPRAVEIAAYFQSTEGRVDDWWFSGLGVAERQGEVPFRTPIFHRTLTSWIDMIVDAGLMLEKLGEPTAHEGLEAGSTVLAETRVAPISLHVRARKPPLAAAKDATAESGDQSAETL